MNRARKGLGVDSFAFCVRNARIELRTADSFILLFDASNRYRVVCCRELLVHPSIQSTVLLLFINSQVEP